MSTTEEDRAEVEARFAALEARIAALEVAKEMSVSTPPPPDAGKV